MKKSRNSQNKPGILPEDLDFTKVFRDENAGEEPGFEEMFKASSRDSSLKKLMEEKKSSSRNNTISKSHILSTYPPPQETLDLHGLTEEQAISEVTSFINREASNRTKTVRIITGKGLHSENGPVLRNSIELFAHQLIREGKILAWKWEKKIKEKSGAAIFYLKHK